MKKEKVVAALLIRDASKMTPRGRKDVAAWLSDHADSLVRDGKNYSRLFRGRYFAKEASRG